MRRFALVLPLVAVVVIASFTRPAGATVDRTQAYPAVHVPSAPAFDPTLADPNWNNAVTATGFEDLTTRRPEPLSTTAYLLYDTTNMYVGFRASQDGVPVRADHSTNDVGFGQDDAVGVCVDTSGAGSQVYCFEATPRSVRYQQATESTRYAPPWQAKAVVNGSSWSAMFVIPLKDLRAASGSHQTWRFNFIRIVASTGEHYTWAYDGLMQDGQPPNWPQFTDARFWPALTDLQIETSAARPLPRVEIYGLESAGRDRNVFLQASNQLAPQTARNYGVDFTYPLTSTIAAVGTLNPDFSNVEVDQQTIVPQEFPRNLSEYRPFLAQGAQYFTPDQTVPAGGFTGPPYQVFYSPSIGTFDRGFKLEGTYGEQSLGALEVRGISNNGSAVDDQAFGFEHQLPDKTFLYWTQGVLAHHGGGNDSTFDTGFKGRDLKTGFVYGFNQALEDFNAAGEALHPYFDPARRFAYERNAFVDVHKPNYEVLQGYQDVSPGYGPLDGFTPVDDTRGPLTVFDFTGTTPGLKSWSGFFVGDRYLSRGGIVHQADFFGNEDIVTNGLVHVNFAVGDSELNDPLLTGGQAFPFDQTSLALGYRDGTPAPVDFFYSAGNFSGQNLAGAFSTQFSTFFLQQFSASTTRQLGTRLSLQTLYAGNRERSSTLGTDGQELRSLAIGDSFGPDANVTLALRSINGSGGFAQPGVNFAAGFHERFRNQSELFVNFGTPAAPTTLDRLIVKYLLRIGGGAGT